MSNMSLVRLPRLSLPQMSLPVKLSVVGASLSIALIGALAMLFRRKRKKHPPLRRGLDKTDRASVRREYTNHMTSSRLQRVPPSKSPIHGKSPNGDVGSRSWSPSLQKSSLSGSTNSVRSDSASTSTLTMSPAREALSAEQLCELGLECIQTAIRHWEDAIEKIDEADDELSPELEALQDQLHDLIGRAYHMRNIYEQRLFHHVSTAAALDAAIQELDREYEKQQRRSTSSLSESSDQDSFVSALEMLDLSDLELQKETHQNLALYEAALLELTHGSIPYRTLRTEQVMVCSDTEFLAKLYCIRLAFGEMFSDNKVRQWFKDMGRQVIAEILVKADRDPEEFQTAYDDMMDYVSDYSNWAEIEEELRGRGVKAMSFYDIVIDFLLFDAFDDLDNPPSSVMTVIQNRWLSNGFKETALATAVWSVLKAKRRMLTHPKGFISHFYAISEHVTPVLAWGYLGPSGAFKELCFFFKEQVMAFMRDVFSFRHARYTLVEHLAEDILNLSHLYSDRITEQLSS